MANAEHVKLASSGPDALDNWREINPDTQLDLEGADLSDVRVTAADYARAAQRVGGESPLDVKVLGPVESPLARIKGRHRWQMLLRSPTRSHLRRFVASMLTLAQHGQPTGRDVTVIVDVDPLSMM